MESFRLEVNREAMEINELWELFNSLTDAIRGLVDKNERYRISLLITMEDSGGE